ncbi:MAG: formate dehydrogenase accessory sulfurtransferase FdhD [Nitrospirae bacterium]|nr:formate dehydrogenase accessory sulfurtransferase FdhD [Nitrospirota bacterium]
MKDYKHIRIVKIKENTSVEADDLIALERRVKISVNGKYLLSLYCTPLMIREFVVGVIHNEGLISGEWCADRMSIEYGDEILVDIPASGTVTEGERAVTSGCAGGISFVRPLPDSLLSDSSSFHADTVREIFREFQKKSEVYRLTGGVHSAALTDGKTILAFAEDIGRHNAVDKVIGYCLLENIPFEGSMMLASGRLSSEIVSKCARSRIPVVISRAAPTSLAIEIAGKTGVTIVGFMRGDRMNVYSCSNRIIV